MKTPCAVATMTRASTEREAEALSRSLVVLDGLRIPVFVADAGSVPDLVSAVKRMPNVEFEIEGRNLVQQVKGSVHRAMACGAEIVVYTEPDKQDFFTKHLLTFAGQALSGEATITIAARDAVSLATFPSGQRQIEGMFRELAALFLGPVPDLLFGPLALRSQFAAQIATIPDDLGWGWRPYLIARAVRAGYHPAIYEGHFPCPDDQMGEDDPLSRRYRLRQFLENIRGLYAGLTDDDRPA